jgi:hypothetical protein
LHMTRKYQCDQCGVCTASETLLRNHKVSCEAIFSYRTYQNVDFSVNFRLCMATIVRINATNVHLPSSGNKVQEIIGNGDFHLHFRINFQNWSDIRKYTVNYNSNAEFVARNSEVNWVMFAYQV